jgi:small subunit ribosomal protein S16
VLSPLVPPPRSQILGETTAVAVKIKLKRMGKIREPFYRIVVADARTKRDGRAIEEIGKYHPKADPSVIEVNSDRVQHWLSVGAQPTDPVRHLLTITGDWQKFKGEPGTEGTLKVAAPKADKKERYETLVKESLAAKETKSAKKDTAAKSSRSKKTEAKDAEAKAEVKDEAPKAEAKKQEAPKAAAKEQKAEKAGKPEKAEKVTAEASDGGTEA